MSFPLAFDPASSFDRFMRGAEEFFSRLGDIYWPAMVIALAFYLAHLLARSRAWQNVLRAAYPRKKVPYWKVTAAYFAGAGLNSFIPARVGDAVKIFLAKKSIRGSTYPTITSSFFVQSVFDTSAGIIVFVYALTQGLLPEPPELPRIPAFEISFWAENPQLLIFFLTALGIGVIVLFAVLARRAEEFWDRVKQGVVVLTDIPLYLRTVASWQGVAWLLRFGAFFFFLEAFNIGGYVRERADGDERAGDHDAAAADPGRRGRPAGAAGGDPGRAWADRGAHLLGRPADRDRGLDRDPRLHRARVVFRTTDWRTLIRSAEKDTDTADPDEQKAAKKEPQPG